MTPGRMLQEPARYGYTTVGHVTIDVMQDGSRRPGGTAFYSALQAARLGHRALIVTRAVPSEIEDVLGPYAGELDVRVIPAAHTTTLATRGEGRERSQRLLAWAGRIADGVAVDTDILHLAPVARETPSRWSGRADFVGLTPQGLLRSWEARDGRVSLAQPGPNADPHEPAGAAEALALAGACDALVLSREERRTWPQLVAAATSAGATVAVTDGGDPNTLLSGAEAGERMAIAVPTVADVVEDLGAGDVYAAALFVALQRGRSVVAAAAFANAAAGVRMMGRGPGAVADLAAVEDRLRVTGAG